jgi:polyisoprenoid-binding protein YceI
MPIPPGAYTLGPENARLLVRTGRTGAAAKAGHDLVIEATAWRGTLELGDAPNATLSVDTDSFRVREGTGGMQSLGDDDKLSIKQTIDEDILKRETVEFRSTAVNQTGDRLTIRGDVGLRGTKKPIEFDLSIADDGHLTGSATVTQSEFGIKPYSTLFGTLKVADEVQVTIDGRLI